MSNRLTQIATRTGDDGSTGLGDGTRTRKDALRVAAMGDVDELNSGLGVLLAEPLPDAVRALLVTIQHELFNLGGELSIPGYTLLKAEAVVHLDEALARRQLRAARRDRGRGAVQAGRRGHPRHRGAPRLGRPACRPPGAPRPARAGLPANDGLVVG